MTLEDRFCIFYWNCDRQESNRSYTLKMLSLRNFQDGTLLYKANEQEFNELVKLLRLISAEYPEALRIDESVSYQDPFDKIIGEHRFRAELDLNHVQLKNLFQAFANKMSR